MKIQHYLSRHKMIWIVVLCVLAVLLLSASTSFAAPEKCMWRISLRPKRVIPCTPSASNMGYQYLHLMRANPHLQNPNRIYAGTNIYIPCGPGGPGMGGPCSYVHYVAWGQTLNEIALYYRVSPYAIAQANGITNLNLIYAGEPLCIP